MSFSFKLKRRVFLSEDPFFPFLMGNIFQQIIDGP